jgi:hypothetical protein
MFILKAIIAASALTIGVFVLFNILFKTGRCLAKIARKHRFDVVLGILIFFIAFVFSLMMYAFPV